MPRSRDDAGLPQPAYRRLPLLLTLNAARRRIAGLLELVLALLRGDTCCAAREVAERKTTTVRSPGRTVIMRVAELKMPLEARVPDYGLPAVLMSCMQVSACTIPAAPIEDFGFEPADRLTNRPFSREAFPRRRAPRPSGIWCPSPRISISSAMVKQSVPPAKDY